MWIIYSIGKSMRNKRKVYEWPSRKHIRYTHNMLSLNAHSNFKDGNFWCLWIKQDQVIILHLDRRLGKKFTSSLMEYEAEVKPSKIICVSMQRIWVVRDSLFEIRLGLCQVMWLAYGIFQLREGLFVINKFFRLFLTLQMVFGLAPQTL